MTDFLKTFALIYGLFASALIFFSLLATSPRAYAFGDSMDAVVGSVAGFVSQAMDTDGGDDE